MTTWLEERERARSGPPARHTAATGGEERATSQLWPPVVTDPRTLTRQVWDESSAASIPSVAKALAVYQLAGVMSLDCFRGDKPLSTRPRILDQPDLTAPGAAWFIRQHVRDWLLSGNACHLVTARDAEGMPAATRYRPAHMWSILQTPDGDVTGYTLNGVNVPADDVVHVRRDSDPGAPGRGVGIVEQHIRTLDRAGLEEESERQSLRGGSVPSVAVIAPQRQLTQAEANEAADSWETKLGGPGRRPAVLPNGTQVIPLTWSATDQQMTEARKMTLVDVGNLANLDAYWLGAPGSSHTYRSPGPLWLSLLRVTLEPMLRLFEDSWSQSWFPRGRRVVFRRSQLTQDDLQTSIATWAAARAARLATYEESRIGLGWDPDVPEPEPAALAAAPAPAGNQDNQDPATPATGEDTTP